MKSCFRNVNRNTGCSVFLIIKNYKSISYENIFLSDKTQKNTILLKTRLFCG